MSYTAPGPRRGKGERPSSPAAAASATAGGGSPILSLLRHQLEHPTDATLLKIVDATEQAVEGVAPVFTPAPELLALLDLPDVPAPPATPPDLTPLRDLAQPHLIIATALAAALPSAADAVHAPDLRPTTTAVIAAALLDPPNPRSAKEAYQLARATRNTLATELTAFREAALGAGSTNDPGLSEAAMRVLFQVYVLRRWLLESAWPQRLQGWLTLDRLAEATYWPPDAVTLTRIEERLREYQFRRWPSAGLG